MIVYWPPLQKETAEKTLIVIVSKAINIISSQWNVFEETGSYMEVGNGISEAGRCLLGFLLPSTSCLMFPNLKS